MNKDIILIGGTSGVGKTTLARELSYKLSIDHRLGTGFIREILRSQIDYSTNPSLHTYTFETDNPVQNFQQQCEIIFPAVIACINRADNEGTSLIIEGNHLIPSLYKDIGKHIFVLESPSYKMHFDRIQGNSHSRRNITEDDFSKVRVIEDYIIQDAKLNNIPTIKYTDNIDEIVNSIKNE